MKKLLIAGIASAALLCGTVIGASANAIVETIQAQLNWSIKFKVDGADWTPEDSEGNPLAPIVYNQTTYLPVRAVSEALDVAVDWDGDTQTVILGERTDQVAITKVNPNVGVFAFATTDKQYTVQDGTDYESGYILESINSAAKQFTLKPDGKYQKLTLTVFLLDDKHDIDLRVVNDNDMVLEHAELTSDSRSVTLDMDIGGSKSVVVKASGSLNSDSRIFVTGYYQ